MDSNRFFLVRVSCMTYNQHAYITDAMNGFVMQQTNFPFVCTIIDDASTDGEQNVIGDYLRENFDLQDESIAYEKDSDYGHVAFARHRTNKNCYFAVISLKENHYSQKKSKAPYIAEWMDTKYVALCEGDDYWTDSMKLQKQVDFMEGHEEYSMCFHKVDVLGDTNENYIYRDVKAGDYSARDIYENWVVPTCSVLYRKGAPLESNPAVVFGDIFMYLQLAERGLLHCMGFVGGVYRRYIGSSSCAYPVETSVRLFYQYKFMEKRFPQLKDISVRTQEQELRRIIYSPYFPGIWKYRLIYAFRHPKLLFSSFMLTTFLSYTPIRNHKFWKKEKTS